MTVAYANLVSTVAPKDFGRVAVLFGGKSAEREAVSYTHLTLPTIYSV